MKTKILTFIALGCFVFTACSKDDTSQDNREETIEINGKQYTIDYLRSEMARNLKANPDSMTFNREDTTFTYHQFYNARISVLRLFN